MYLHEDKKLLSTYKANVGSIFGNAYHEDHPSFPSSQNAHKLGRKCDHPNSSSSMNANWNLHFFAYSDAIKYSNLKPKQGLFPRGK